MTEVEKFISEKNICPLGRRTMTQYTTLAEAWDKGDIRVNLWLLRQIGYKNINKQLEFAGHAAQLLEPIFSTHYAEAIGVIENAKTLILHAAKWGDRMSLSLVEPDRQEIAVATNHTLQAGIARRTAYFVADYVAQTLGNDYSERLKVRAHLGNVIRSIIGNPFND
jgi:hypothetical protein